jgi:hypothetical protein
MSQQQVITLNSAKKGPDNLYHKLEIPIAIAKAGQVEAEDFVDPFAADSRLLHEAFCIKDIDPMASNSNCQLEYSHAHGLCQVIASLQGPSESKFGSKQDYEKAFVEINLRMPHASSAMDESLTDVKLDVAANLRTCLEAILQGTSYPKQLFTFQVSVVLDTSGASYSHVFPACLNACIALLNQTGIAQKDAPCFAATIGVASLIDESDRGMEVDSIEKDSFRLQPVHHEKC